MTIVKHSLRTRVITQRHLHHLSLNIIIIVSNIYLKHHECMKTYVPTMQCNSKTLHCVKCSKYLWP